MLDLHFGDISIQFVLSGDFASFWEVIDLLPALQTYEIVASQVSDVPVKNPIF